MNITCIMGNNHTFGREFDILFNEFCKGQIESGSFDLRPYAKYAGKFKEIFRDKFGDKFFFSDFENFLNGQIREVESAQRQLFISFIEKFIADFIKEYYTGYVTTGNNVKTNVSVDRLKFSKDLILSRFTDSLMGIFSRAVFSEVSFAYMLEECQHYIDIEEGPFRNNSKKSNFKMKFDFINFNYGDLLWKGVMMGSNQSYASGVWTNTHKTSDMSSTMSYTKDIRFEASSLYVHGDMKSTLSRSTETVTDFIENKISQSHVICIYAMSLEDDTYKEIFTGIMQRLKDEHITLVIFDDNDDYNPKSIYYKRKREEYYMKALGKYIGSSEGETDIWSLKDRIHYAYNKEIFSLDWYKTENRVWDSVFRDKTLRL